MLGFKSIRIHDDMQFFFGCHPPSSAGEGCVSKRFPRDPFPIEMIHPPLDCFSSCCPFSRKVLSSASIDASPSSDCKGSVITVAAIYELGDDRSRPVGNKCFCLVEQ